MVELHWAAALAAVAVSFTVGAAWGAAVTRTPTVSRLRAYARGYHAGADDERATWTTSMRNPQ